MDLNSIIDIDLPPLNEEEKEIVRVNYRPRDFDSMTSEDAILLVKLLMTAQGNLFDDEKFMLLLRRLNMIVDFRANPELLI